jgi:hypothetical protein
MVDFNCRALEDGRFLLEGMRLSLFNSQPPLNRPSDSVTWPVAQFIFPERISYGGAGRNEIEILVSAIDDAVRRKDIDVRMKGSYPLRVGHGGLLCFLARSGFTEPVEFFDASVNLLTENNAKAEFYNGCYVNAILRVVSLKQNGFGAIILVVSAIQFAGHGDRLDPPEPVRLDPRNVFRPMG